MPINYKIGLINSLLHRCYHLVSNYERFHNEVVKLQGIMVNNGYPVKVFDKCVNKFLMRLFTQKPTVLTAERKEISLVLPYLGAKS